MSLSVRYIPKNGTKSKLTGLTMMSILLQRRLYQFIGLTHRECMCLSPNRHQC